MILKNEIQGSFTIIENSVMRNEHLSANAKVFYSLMQSYSDEWNVNLRHFAKMMGVSEAMARKARQELIDIGLLEYERIKDEKGKFTQESIYILKTI